MPPTPEREPISACVLAGGRSERMGRDKARIPFEGEPLLLRKLRQLGALSPDVRVVADRADRFVDLGVRAVPDALARGEGPLPAVLAALRVAAHERVLITAVDMPFFVPKVAEALARLVFEAEDADVAALPSRKHPGEPEPLFAVYRRRAAEPLLESLRAGERSLRKALAGARIAVLEEAEWRSLDPHGLATRNVNTEQDLRDAEALLRDGLVTA